ncbi:MAG TPA: lipopolysaccharide assembly protein LapA domain-containing protein [Streptosporangiaceae bacterium]|nr:lipopolysaccharide assembly protein LapA domain-containing protein [Streptosporangiaceae bacterium]
MAADHQHGRASQQDAEPTPAQDGEPAPAPGSGSPQSQPPSPAGEAEAAEKSAEAVVARTRLSGLWAAIGFFAIVLVFLLIFIVQNDTKVNISYLGVHGQLTLAIAMLSAALAGIVLTLLAGTARILQLRAAARRKARH